MKRLTSLIMGVAAAIAPPSAATIATEDPDSLNTPASGTRLYEELRDSVPDDIMLLSDDEGTPSFFKGVIPPSPQAAAIARYAEYPVSHTTGIPDISVPLYEIDLGGYAMPISISYHASGSKPDQMPTCVGLGWCLNAGGAVSRTVLGNPDMYYASASSTDYRYFSTDAIRSLLDDINKGSGNSDPAHLSSIIGNSPEWDTESDRYTFNVAGKTGVFRYSQEDSVYVVLNNSNDVVTSYGRSGSGISFRLRSTDGVTYDFCKEENTGVTDRFNEQPFTSTWYVTLIHTPYGDITFTYDDAKAVDIHTQSITATSGPIRKIQEQSTFGGGTEYVMVSEYRIEHSESPYTISYGQKILKKIEWAGGTVEFDYVDENPYKTLQRLTSMKVYSEAGELRKSVTFGNTDNWPTGSSLTGRRLLTSVTDSEHGVWRFEYNRKKELPPLSDIMLSPACQSDLWGYLNTTTRSSARDAFTEGQIEWLKAGVDDYGWFTGSDIAVQNAGFRDRSPDLACTQAGVLEMVTFPTGGSIRYEYELNSLGSRKCGGLRVKSATECESGASSGCKTTYSYSALTLTTEDPETLMNYYSHVLITRSPSSPTPPELGHGAPYSYRSCSVFPVNPVTASSNSVLYNVVTETSNDGSSIRFVYDDKELSELFGVPSDRMTHPSLYQQSVWDFGSRQPLLTSKTVYDAAGNEMYSETYEYIKQKRKTFSTGVRTACLFCEYEIPPSPWNPGPWQTTYSIAHYGKLQYVSSTAFSRVCLLKKKTVSYADGFTSVTDYAYDSSFRTMSPRTITLTNSCGSVVKTEATYPFDHNDATSRAMTDNIQTDCPVETRRYAGSSLISKTVTEYGLHADLYRPVSVSSWSLPTGTPPGGQVTLTERERVSSYNAKGRPLSITVNGTDVTSFTWNSAGDLLLSSTAPGGLVTKYTHRPLFGLASVTRPNGYATSYTYNSAGMLAKVSDASGPIESYSYSISGHPTMNSDGNSVTTMRHLGSSGVQYTLSRQYYSGLGLESTRIEGGANISGKYLYSTTAYDALMRPCETVLPGAGGTVPEWKPYLEVTAVSKETHGEEFVFSRTSYDALDRPVWNPTSGDAWHAAGKGKSTQYVSNAANSVRLYRAPMDRISLVEDGYYAAKTLQGVRTVDEDGNEMTVYTDRLGRKVLERRGPESRKGENDTYFVYNALGQLRYVLSPGYELSGYKEKFAYEYRYDCNGNVVKKFIPGAGYTQYWYDRAGRLAFMQDPNLRERGEHRFFVYDRAGRLAIQGVSASCNRSEAVNFADYAGGTAGFSSTGYTLTDASRLQKVTLETVNYYDSYTFASTLSSALVKTGASSAKGFLTGSVEYNSDGNRSLSAFYYDARGNVTESRIVPPLSSVRTTVNKYTYTGQPLKSTVTEGSVTIVTENTYHAASGLLTATDVTVNGVKQRVSAVEYDDLGRIKSVTRGAASNSGGKVSYTYNIHGQTESITGPGFSQKLFYTDGPGKKLYNGSVSAMTWTMGTDPRVRGYRYSYNGYGWLTAAEYGENDDQWANRDRYTERFLEFMRNGGVRRLQRHGLKADGVHGKVDNLHISYDGNRITTVLEDAGPVTQNGSMDYPGTKREMEFAYNEWGALVSDESRGITDIAYDRLGNPVRISYSDGSYTQNVYSASGEKLKTVHATSLNGTVTATSTVEYRGNVIYKDGKVDMVLFPGGYATVSGTAVTFHYYTQDYIGNNRAVINGSTGAIEQTVAYYPYGAVIADLGTPTTGQPYKFGGKELITANGLNEYDFGARQYYSAVPHFTSIDPLCEENYDLSPYLFCGNDPVNKVDPTGEFFDAVWDVLNVGYDVGAAIYHHATGNHEAAKGNWVDAGCDVVAAAVPFLPAGTSKGAKMVKNALGKADKAVDAVSDGKKASKGLKNAAAIKEGKEYNGIMSSKAKKRRFGFLRRDNYCTSA